MRAICHGPGGGDHAFARDNLRGGANDDVHAGLNVRVPGLADPGDSSVLDADVCLDDPPVVNDERVGDHRVRDLRVRTLALSHAVADHLAAAEFHFLAVDGVILLDFDPQFGIREPHTVADSRAEHVGIRRAGQFVRHFSAPITFPRKP
jgi:hypothetical protein